MGCAPSRADNEKSEVQSKKRKDYMKQAVRARSAFASAHAAYTVALKSTGGALQWYADGETLHFHSSTSHVHVVPRETIQPPPPPPFASPSPLQRAVSMPDISIPRSQPLTSDTIREEEEQEDIDRGNNSSNAESHPPTGDQTPLRPPPPLPSYPTPVSKPPPIARSDYHWDFFSETDDTILPPSVYKDNEISSGEKGKSKVIENDNAQSKDAQNNANGSESPLSPPLEIDAAESLVKPVKKQKQSVLNHQNTVPLETKKAKTSMSNINLSQIIKMLDIHFIHAYESSSRVKNILEANRIHYHSNFVDNRGSIDHSARVMRAITWNQSIKSKPNDDDMKETDADAVEESHATVLDKLLAWEKKFCDEIKTVETMKVRYQRVKTKYDRKVALHEEKKKNGTRSESLEKIKADVSYLQTKYIVDVQSLESTISEIIHLRDDKLYPRLLELAGSLSKMWEEMHAHHYNQYRIALELRTVGVSNSPEETSDDHHRRTKQLKETVQTLYQQFKKIVDHQKEYILALNSWLRLTLVPIETNLKENVSPSDNPDPPIMYLLREWQEQLRQIPEGIANNSLSTFVAIIDSIVILQEEEMRQKDKYEEMEREYNIKHREFANWYKKYGMDRTDDADGENTEGAIRNEVTEKRSKLDMMKKNLEDEREKYQGLCRQAREKSMTSLKSHLPVLFNAMAEFSLFCSEMYKKLESITLTKQEANSI